ncbi:molecular chaperone DnaJ [Apiospora arundinis]|uniref:Molecular chaperone DnaJ n=2 Tax=Apiospora TaxID=1811811 RepID=A0ABR2IWY1_9PEZI
MGQVPDHYAILQVSQTASEDDIKKSYRRLVLRTHPDKCPDDTNASKRFQTVSESYKILSDPIKRAAYDLENRGKQYSPGQDRKPSDGFAGTTHAREDEPTDFESQEAEICEFWANILEKELASLRLMHTELWHQRDLVQTHIMTICTRVKELFEEEKRDNTAEKSARKWIAFLLCRRDSIETKACRARRSSERVTELLGLDARLENLKIDYDVFTKKIDTIDSIKTTTYRRLLNAQYHGTRAQARDRAEQERKEAQRQRQEKQSLEKEYEDWLREERERIMSEIAEQERLEKQRVKADCEAWKREEREREVLADRARAIKEYNERERKRADSAGVGRTESASVCTGA